MTDYKAILGSLYESTIDFDQWPLYDELAFIGDHVFGFTTYDDYISRELAYQMVNTIKSILNKETFEYIKDSDNYMSYITMCNMPFLREKIDWGTSVRGAWFDTYAKKVFLVGETEVPYKEMPEFFKQMIEWLVELEAIRLYPLHGD